MTPMKQDLMKKLYSLHCHSYIRKGQFAVVWQQPQGMLSCFLETDDEIFLHNGHIYMFYITTYGFSALNYQQHMEYHEGLPSCVIKL